MPETLDSKEMINNLLYQLWSPDFVGLDMKAWQKNAVTSTAIFLNPAKDEGRIIRLIAGYQPETGKATCALNWTNPSDSIKKYIISLNPASKSILFSVFPRTSLRIPYEVTELNVLINKNSVYAIGIERLGEDPVIEIASAGFSSYVAGKANEYFGFSFDEILKPQSGVVLDPYHGFKKMVTSAVNHGYFEFPYEIHI